MAKVSVEGIIEYLDKTGIGERIANLKLGDNIGIEIPVDEEHDVWLRFWLSMEGSEDEPYVRLNFDKMIDIRVLADEKRLDEWFKTSGFLELAALGWETAYQEESKEEVTE